MIVKHAAGAYEILESDLCESLGDNEGSFVITDKCVKGLYEKLIRGTPQYVVEVGEQSKNLVEFGRIHEWLAENNADRFSTILAFGGGMIGDLAGFVAATYMRGVNLVQIPTTLLAMVDSSVGGKVAVNLEQGKNLVGAFYPPVKVLLDYRFLATLPVSEINNGAAEIWKYGAILDWQLFEQLEAQPLGPGDKRFPEIVMHCIDLKRQVVESDEHETSGARAILNFGHTVGHAIERSTSYAQVRHGEAVAAGMIVEAVIGEKLGLTPPGMNNRLRIGLERQGLRNLARLEPTVLIEAMKRDKKASKGRLAFALLTGYGSCKLVPDVPESVVLECLQEHI